jgi:hypothetical protein
MELVSWNDALSEGQGRSGTRYALCFQPAGDEAGGGRWRIDVDGAEICTVESAESAVRRAEGLEAIRCVIRGRSAELSEDQVQYAEVIAREMTEAADRATTDAPAAARPQLLQSLRSLRSVSGAIRRECARRAREEEEPVLPLRH